MRNKKPNIFNSIKTPLILFIVFWSLAISLWQSNNDIFYLFNFGYIGSALGLGLGLYNLLPRKNKPSARRLSQLLIGIYMLGFLGIVKTENMQLEGFFFYLLSGYVSGSVIHYLVAKIMGPILFGRGFCGWACWTAMVLDYLPYKRNKPHRIDAKWELLRYVSFGFSLLLVVTIWFYFRDETSQMELVWLLVGNAVYFSTAIILAFVFKDNRAFCKYLCPITVFLKATTRFSLIKIEAEKNKCTQCGTCSKMCPMDIDVMKYVNNGKRVLSTECISCLTCTTVCPEGILDNTYKLDFGGKEYIQRKKQDK